MLRTGPSQLHVGQPRLPREPVTFGGVEEGAPVGVATPGVLASCEGVSLGSCVGEGGELLSVFCDGILPLPVTNGGREGM